MSLHDDSLTEQNLFWEGIMFTRKIKFSKCLFALEISDLQTSRKPTSPKNVTLRTSGLSFHAQTFLWEQANQYPAGDFPGWFPPMLPCSGSVC
jgi:hypothetical protein